MHTHLAELAVRTGARQLLQQLGRHFLPANTATSAAEDHRQRGFCAHSTRHHRRPRCRVLAALALASAAAAAGAVDAAVTFWQLLLLQQLPLLGEEEEVCGGGDVLAADARLVLERVAQTLAWQCARMRMHSHVSVRACVCVQSPREWCGSRGAEEEREKAEATVEVKRYACKCRRKQTHQNATTAQRRARARTRQTT